MRLCCSLWRCQRSRWAVSIKPLCNRQLVLPQVRMVVPYRVHAAILYSTPEAGMCSRCNKMSCHTFPASVSSRHGSDGGCTSKQATRRARATPLTMPRCRACSGGRIVSAAHHCAARMRSRQWFTPLPPLRCMRLCCTALHVRPLVARAPPPLRRVRLDTTAHGLRVSTLVACGLGLAQVRGAARLQRVAVARLQLWRQLRRRRPRGGARHVLRLPPLLAERPVRRVEVVALLCSWETKVRGEIRMRGGHAGFPHNRIPVSACGVLTCQYAALHCTRRCGPADLGHELLLGEAAIPLRQLCLLLRLNLCC